MKIDEFKTQPVNEIFDVAKAAVKGFVSGKGTEQALQQDIFVKDFYQDALTSIKLGLSNKAINSPDKTAVAAPSAAPSAASSAGVAPTKESIKKGKMQESKYADLDLIFESILNLDEDEVGESMSSFLQKWFATYMSGINWQPDSALVNRDIKNIEDLYNQGKNYKAAIKSLASTAYGIYKKLGKTPAGLQNVVQGNKPGQPIAGAAGPGQNVGDRLKAVWGKLTPEQKKEFLKFARTNP